MKKIGKKKAQRVLNKNLNKNFKSSWLIVLGLLVLLVILAIIIKIQITGNAVAINPDNPSDPLGIGLNPDNVPQTPEELQNKSTNYLKGEWVKILENKQFGWIVLGVRDSLIKLNFFWKPVLGMEYSLSWLFIFALAIWLILFFILSDLVVFFSDKKIVRGLIAFLITSIIGTSGVIKKAADLLSFVIKNTWIAWISLVIAILIMVLIVRLGGGLKVYLEKQKEVQAKDKLDQDRKIIDTEAKVAKKQLESYEDGAGI